MICEASPWGYCANGCRYASCNKTCSFHLLRASSVMNSDRNPSGSKKTYDALALKLCVVNTRRA